MKIQLEHETIGQYVQNIRSFIEVGDLGNALKYTKKAQELIDRAKLEADYKSTHEVNM
jgi:hypothetical protein